MSQHASKQAPERFMMAVGARLPNDCSLRESHEPTMAADLFLAGIQE
jgi:hypothetical protein